MLWKRLFEAREGIATLVVSHRHAALSRADRVIVMEQGCVVAVGAAEELEKTSATFQAIWAGALAASPQ
jgi:ABC-type multidrug transport system fused ATPase/permease subunit